MQTHLCALQYLEKGVAHRSVRRKEKMEKEYDVLVVGPVSLDHNIDYLGNERSEVGGAVVASGWAAAGSGAKAAIFCKLNPEEADVNERFEGIKADLYWKPSAHTCSIRNQYFTADKEKRACTSLGKCDPFRFDEMADIKTRMYHFAGLVFILAVDLFCGHQARAGDGSVKIIGVSSAPGGEIKSGLRPDGGVARVGMHYAANLRKATVKRQMRWRVGRGLFAAFHHLAAGYLNHHHIVGGHYLILNAGRLNHHPLPRFVYRADIAPGERHQMMNGKRQVCRQHVSFQLL